MINDLLNVLKSGNNKILYKINGNYITYKECYRKVLELSDYLKKQGNSCVIVYGHKSIDQFVSILACIVAKRCYIPIDLCTPVYRIKEIIEQSKASLIIKNEDLLIDEIDCLTIYELKEQYQDSNNYFSQCNKNAYIIFTSGSTGNSKGVPISYENLNNFISWIINNKELMNCKDIILLNVASFSFDLSVMDIYFSIFTHSTIVALDNNTKSSFDKLYELLNVEHINFISMTPTFIKLLLVATTFNQNNYPHLKHFFFCGECLEVNTVCKIVQRFPNISVINAYGPTEATCCVSLVKIDSQMLEDKVLPVGLLNTSAVDIEIENDEIVLKGESVFNGYLNSDKSLKYVNGYKTGDLGYINDNYIYCLGRLDSQVKYQGYRIELGDIENNLLKINGVKEAVVMARYKDNSHIVKLIKAFVVVDHNIDEKTIKLELSKLVPSYMVPKKITIMDAIPVNHNDKYDRKVLNNYDRYL